MIGFPHVDLRGSYQAMLEQIRDRQTQEEFEMPVEYVIKGVPEKGYGESGDRDPVLYTLSEMDRWGVDIGLVSVGKGDAADVAVARFPERFVPSFAPDPNQGVEAIRKIRAAHESYGLRALTFFPAGFSSQVPIDHRLMYPIYSTCVELGLPVFVTAGIAGPRVPSACQHVELVEQVLFDFPELTFVLRHGAEPRGGVGGQANGEVAESSLLDKRFLAPVLSKGGTRLRQHARSRSADLWWVFPDGPLAGADYDGDVRCATA